MRILVVEDEKKTATYLSRGLAEEGYVVDAAGNGEDGLYMGRTNHYDLIILDVMLPDAEGWEVLSDLRSAGKSTSVLFLSARDSVADRVKGLELGADDYLVKPFAFSELLARIRSILRRGPAQNLEEVQVADLRIELPTRRVWRAGQRVDLTPKEFSLLTLLARRTGEVLSRTLIASEVWDINYDSISNVVDVHIRRLRAKVDDAFPQKLIHTIRGVGYVLEERG